MATERKEIFKIAAKTALLRRGISIKSLAKHLGRNRSSVSEVINGRRPFPTLKKQVEEFLNL